jgi:hypothetical protein
MSEQEPTDEAHKAEGDWIFLRFSVLAGLMFDAPPGWFWRERLLYDLGGV